MLGDRFVDRGRFAIGDVNVLDATAALTHTKNHVELLSAGTLIFLGASETALGFAADIRFIDFYDAAKLLKRAGFVLHCLANTMRQIPSGAVGTDSQVLFQLVRRDAFLRVYDDSKGHEPLVQGKMRVIEDRSASGRELLFACWLQALKDAGTLFMCALCAVLLFARHGVSGPRDAADLIHATGRAANDAIGPAHLLDVP